MEKISGSSFPIFWVLSTSTLKNLPEKVFPKDGTLREEHALPEMNLLKMYVQWGPLIIPKNKPPGKQ